MLNKPCPHCGAYNEESAPVCYYCKKEFADVPQIAKLPAKKTPANGASSEGEGPNVRRPGCLTIYAGWMLLSGALGILMALVLPTMIARDPTLWTSESFRAQGLDPQALELIRRYFAYYFVFIFVASIVTLVNGWGLWTMRNWARILVLISQGFSLIAGVFLLFSSFVITHANPFICGVYGISLIFPGIVFFWFLTNRRAFR
jgi:uncharacterized membrane protein (DUF2068 family)